MIGASDHLGFEFLRSLNAIKKHFYFKKIKNKKREILSAREKRRTCKSPIILDVPKKYTKFTS